MKIRLTGFSTPFFGASWEYSEERKKEQEAIELLFIILQGKRLITLPDTRNSNVKFERDIIQCSFSTLDLKGKIMMILEKYTLPSETKSILKDMICCCNDLLETLPSFESSVDDLNKEISEQRDLFLQEIGSFKKELFSYIEVLSERYKITFSFPE
ncbi:MULTISPECIES: DUF6650 family protein [Bacillus cereus group]|uniref:DUF6650 family protein n=1 Tax=Bacillus cereus group TaxID=86661 RepID=UPI000944AE7F|nr:MULTISPECIES: DUF6650 family protein [Bacillus cereus group]MRD37843.1 hypothetical protein [Bacillus thuringiensis]PEB05725.1 hypothetical protein COM56_17405 [Bacillus cereus]MCZ7522345.1 hypothetical protein [Bacillus pacificus]MDA1575428.1 hypothetical protein [Bacillus cereus group sp. TH242-3LC]MED1583769.1 hypothetical protein [Bacillus pacificus]